MRKTESQKIALCGMLGALSVVLLLLGSALQIGTYAAPMLAAFLLTQIVRGLELEPAALPRFEMRLLLRLECADGRTLAIAGSRTGQDGRLDLSVNGEAASTHTPLRRELDALVAGQPAG